MPDWSHYQQEIFRAVRDTQDSLLIEAVAGSGKTTTIVEAIKHTPSGGRVAFLAFNRAIADELGRRIDPARARCMTLHSAGWTAWRQALAWDAGGCKVDAGKVGGVVRDLLTWEERKANPAVGRVVALAKAAGIVPKVAHWLEFDTSVLEEKIGECWYKGLVNDTDEVWRDLMDHHGIDPDDCDLGVARRVLTRSIELAREVCDFDDMLYMPVVAGSEFERFDTVFVDEAQDLSGIQHEILARMLNGGGRVVAVGDRHQAIYGFRGAHASSMDSLKERFQCRELPLSVSYRCPRLVVEHARQWCERIEWAEDAALGLVEGEPLTPAKWELGQYAPGDAILCRVNRPIVATAYALINRRVPTRVLGRDIGQGIVALARKLAKVKPEITAVGEAFQSAMAGRMSEYRSREKQRLAKRKQWTAWATLDDKLATLGLFVEHAGSIGELVAEVERMFADPGGGAGGAGGAGWQGVTLSTVHKAKGMEWPRVFVLDAGEWMPGPWARRGWEIAQEHNIMYVAATRARGELRYVSSGGASGRVDDVVAEPWQDGEEVALDGELQREEAE